MVRSAIALYTLFLAAGLAHAAIPGTGRIVAGHDANTLSTYTATSQEAQFAVNLAKFISHKPTGGSILLVEPSSTNVLHDYSPIVEQALTDAGFYVATTQDTSWDMERLEAFDGIFLGTIFDEPYRTISTPVLNSFVQSGRGVYMFSGMGPDRVSEAAALNDFLVLHGLTFDDSEGEGRSGYNGVYETEITSEHEIFAGISHLRSANGMNVLWNEGNMGAMLIGVDENRNGLYGVVTNIPVPTPGAITLAAVGGVLVMRRKRK